MNLRRRRRLLLLWSVVPVLLALALAAKLFGAAWFAGQAGDAFARGDAPAVESAAAALGFANVLEPHKAPYAAGDARALRGDFAGARTAFEEALAGAPPADECRVRANLALSIEHLATGSQGSAGQANSSQGSTGDTTARLLGEALAVVKAAPAGCFGSGSADPEAGEQLQSAGERLAEKIAGLGNQPESGPATGQEQTGPEPQDPSETQLDQLRESGKSAQQERDRGLQREEYLDGSSTGPLTDKPW